MESLELFWQRAALTELWGNTMQEFLIAIGVFLLGLIVLKIFQQVILRGLKKLSTKTKTDIDDMLVGAINRFRPPFYLFIALYVSVLFLSVTEWLQEAFDIVLVIWIAYYAVVSLQTVVDFVIDKRITDDTDPSAKTAYQHLGTVLKFVLWVLGGLMVLSNLGIDITTLIAGLGIGGLAIAFAFQKVLEDLFASFAIHFDKPFVLGDFIIVGEHMGVVEHIGIKTTRIRALQGEQIVIANRELTDARIQNFKRLRERRVVVDFGVTYGTSNEKLERIPVVVEDIIDGIEGMRFDRVHFKTFGDSALMYQLVYHIESDDYTVYMDANQEFNLKLKAVFEQEKIDMAFPTQTIFIEKN